MTVKVIRAAEIGLLPRAECAGDNPDEEPESNCPETWDYGRGTLDSVKAHIRAKPTHQVVVIRETRSVYRTDNR